MTRSQTPKGEFTGRHMLIAMTAFFGVIIAVNLTMAILAGRTWTGLEVPNSYVASQDYNDKIASARLQDEMGWKSTLTNSGRRLVFSLQDAKARPIAGAAVDAIFRRPVHEREDKAQQLAWTNAGNYVGEVSAPGVWEVEINVASSSGHNYRQVFRIEVRE